MSSIEQHTSAEKPVAKLESINGQRGAKLPQCEHRMITLKQRQLCVEKPREQRFYVGYCRSSCPSGKEAGSGGYGVGEGEGVCSKECKVNETAHRRMRRLRTEARWLYWRDVFAPPQSDPIPPSLSRSRRSRAPNGSCRTRSDIFQVWKKTRQRKQNPSPRCLRDMNARSYVYATRRERAETHLMPHDRVFSLFGQYRFEDGERRCIFRLS